jgi:hypothetical protein
MAAERGGPDVARRRLQWTKYRERILDTVTSDEWANYFVNARYDQT